MSGSEQLGELPTGFSGTVRLFPLPNLVMFPHVVQPLHIFEPRYREMLEDALAGDQLLAMALLRPGWEPHYEDRPSIFPVICLGRVMTHSQLEDGRYNILLLGLRRASIIRELPFQQAFRRAEVTVLDDLYPSSGAGRRTRLRRELLRCFRQFLPESAFGQQQIQQLFSDSLPLGVLTDIVAFTVQLDLKSKQQLLNEWNVDTRAAVLLERLREMVRSDSDEDAGPPFPPEFSEN